MSTQDQRQEYRFVIQLPVFLELNEDDQHSSSSIVVSNSLDISANGLRVITDRTLPIGSILRTCVQTPSATEGFILITEVMWQSEWKKAGEYLVGLALFESEGSHIQEWKEFIAHLDAESNTAND